MDGQYQAIEIRTGLSLTTSTTDLIQQAKVRYAIKSCTNCSLHSSCTSPVPYSGPSPNSIVALGEAPGYQEDRLGIPFVGPSGQLLRRWLTSLGIEASFVNTVCCYPPERNGSRTPTLDEVNACKSNLHSQLQLIKPSFILTFGNTALSTWWPKIKLGELKQRFWVANWDTGNPYSEGTSVSEGWSWGYSTYHPAAVLRNRMLEREVIDDLMHWKGVLATSKNIPVCRTCVKCKKDGVMEKGEIYYCERHRVDVNRTGPVRFRHLPPLGTEDVKIDGQEKLL